MSAYNRSLYLNNLGKVFALVVLLFQVTAASSNDGPEVAIAVYEHSGKQLIQTVPVSAQYSVITKQSGWNIIRFNKPIIRAWVSADYVIRKGEVVSINANKLNVRMRPAIDSLAITQLSRGYISKTFSESNGFIEILLPTTIDFAVKANNLSHKNEDHVTNTKNRISDVVSATAHLVPNAGIKIVNASASMVTNSDGSPKLVKNIENGVSSVEVNNADTVKKKHQISPGDTISLIVFGEPDMSLSSARVPESGEVSFPLIGSVNVNQKTIKEIEVLVSRLLSQGYIKKPKLSVTIDGYRPIFIKGAVSDTGSFPYSEGLTVAKALALAGGPSESSNSNGVSISRDGDIVISKLSVDSDYTVKSGDIISIKEDAFAQGQAGQYIYLHGEVKTPGAYEYRKGLTIEKAIVLAGGFSARASRRKVSVSRVVEGEEEPVRMSRVKLYLSVEPGDIVDVGASWF